MKPIRIIDTQFNLLAEIDDYQSMFFIKRFHGIGEIELRINRYKQHTDKLTKGNLIIVGSQLNKVFQIKHKEIELDENGKATENWLIKGLPLKTIVAQRLTVPPIGLEFDSVQGNAEAVIKHFINTHIINPVDGRRKIPQLTMGANLNRGPSLSWQSRYENLAEVISNVSSTSGLGWDIYLDIVNKKWVFEVYEGRNVTASQAILPPVIFSPQFESLKSLQYTESELNYKNNAYVGGEGEGAARRIVEVGTNTGLNRHEIFFDARDIKEVDENDQPIPEQDIINQMTNQGQLELEEYMQEFYLEGQILTNSPFKYEVDYNLGDIVTIQNKDWGVTMDARITEIKEIYETNGFRLEATFGNDRPTLIKKIKQELSQISGEVRR